MAAICLEDNPFPKRRSLYNSYRRKLELVQSFCAKIAASKPVQDRVLRAAVTGMRLTLEKLKETQLLSSVEDSIASIGAIAGLVDPEEMRAQEAAFSPVAHVPLSRVQSTRF